MSPLLLGGTIGSVVVGFLSLNMLAGLPMRLPMERRVRRSSTRQQRGRHPARLQELEALVVEFAKGDAGAKSRIVDLVQSTAVKRGLSPVLPSQEVTFAMLDSWLDELNRMA